MRIVSCNIIPYFCPKLGKISQNLLSAAVVIGALRVKLHTGKKGLGLRLATYNSEFINFLLESIDVGLVSSSLCFQRFHGAT